MKTCRSCQETKPIENFAAIYWKNKDGTTKSSHRGSCKACHCLAEKARDKSHRVTVTAAYKRNKRLLWLFGISQEQYDEMLARQNRVCAICQEPQAWNRREGDILVVDHDHSTGQVRGLLCHACNQALGLMRDNPDVLRRAAAYVEVRQEDDIEGK